MQGKITIGFGPILLIGFVILSSSLSRANSADEGGNASSGVTPQELRYTFSWNFDTESDLRPRGGTTTGADVTLAASPSESWKALQKPYQSKFEKDRAAILAMAGEYRASFDFIETLGFYEDHKPTRPYQSWGTEYIFVVEDRRDFISLQHVLVMMMKTPEGGVTEPYVVKHWRQDWTYEDSSINRYVGNRTWRSEEVPKKQRQGNWSQAVFQVDDSPRYESMGRWVHAKGFSSWMSQETWRPLPRREFSVRDMMSLSGPIATLLRSTVGVRKRTTSRWLLESPEIVPTVESCFRTMRLEEERLVLIVMKESSTLISNQPKDTGIRPLISGPQ